MKNQILPIDIGTPEAYKRLVGNNMQNFLENKLYASRLYHNQLGAHQMEVLKFTPEKLAGEAGVSIFSVHSFLKGSLGTLKTLRKITDTLGIKWEYVTRVDLPRSQFHRAVVRTGNSASGAVKRGG